MLTLRKVSAMLSRARGPQTPAPSPCTPSPASAGILKKGNHPPQVYPISGSSCVRNDLSFQDHSWIGICYGGVPVLLMWVFYSFQFSGELEFMLRRLPASGLHVGAA
jgi:hypothetical protein